MESRNLIYKFKIKPNHKVLDIGGSAKQLTEIQVDTLLDLVHPEDDPYRPSKLQAKHFVQIDITNTRFPFKDKEFDFCYCSHTLEDVIDPRNALNEMSRVAKRGVIYTPSRGFDMVFSHYDLTNWNTGGRRIPGMSHHHWFYETIANKLIVTPKNYPILYTNDFQITDWSGPEENEYIWKNKINYEVFFSTSSHELVENYKIFVTKNRKFITSGKTLIWLDNPYYIVKALAKKILNKS